MYLYVWLNCMYAYTLRSSVLYKICIAFSTIVKKKISVYFSEHVSSMLAVLDYIGFLLLRLNSSFLILFLTFVLVFEPVK